MGSSTDWLTWAAAGHNKQLKATAPLSSRQGNAKARGSQTRTGHCGPPGRFNQRTVEEPGLSRSVIEPLEGAGAGEHVCYIPF